MRLINKLINRLGISAVMHTYSCCVPLSWCRTRHDIVSVWLHLFATRNL